MIKQLPIAPQLANQIAIELRIMELSVGVSDMRAACFDAYFMIDGNRVGGTFQNAKRTKGIDRWEMIADLSPWLAEHTEDQIARVEGAINRVIRSIFA